MAIAILVFGLMKKRQLLFYGLLLSFLAYFLVPRVQTRIAGITDPADSARFRIVSWKNALEISSDNLFLGIGFNAYRYIQKDYGFLTPDDVSSRSGAGSDSSLLFVLATTGIIGLSLYVSGFMYPFLDSVFSKRKNRLLMVTIISALFLESLFINSLFYPQIMFIVYTLMFSSSNEM
jgi:hypothetical protein